jgi:CheY-like chemotaxis protein
MTSLRPRVLIIDDDLDQRQILSAALEAEYEVLTASDGLDGYSMACTALPPVIVLDVMMPIVDGWTVLRKLRANPLTRETRVVIATALDSEAVAEESATLNVAAVLRKPIELNDLRSAVKRLQARSHGSPE